MFGINRLGSSFLPGMPRQLPPSRQRFDLDMPLLNFSPKDTWRLRDACEGVQIFGATGSAKSSSSGKAIALSFLRAGFGGIVMSAKPGEADTWRRYAKMTGRERSLIIFGSDGKTRFNFLDYELRRVDQFVTQNLVSLFMRIMDAAAGGMPQDGENRIWRDLAAELLSNCFLALYSAYGTIRLNDVFSLIDSAPRSMEQAVSDETWRNNSFCFATLFQMMSEPVNRLSDNDARVVADFFGKRWANRADRTRSSIEANVSAMAHPFLTGYLHEIFCTTTNILPEMTHEGAIIVLDFPIKEHDASGILAQQIFKYLWQRATERRDGQSRTARPVFCFADECQFFMSEYDLEFQSTARSSKACSVYITQNLPTYYKQMGGRNPQHNVDALMGNLQTKIFHQNTDIVTNKWASDIVGQQWMAMHTHGVNAGRSVGENFGYSSNWSSGGSETGGKVTTTVSRGGGYNEGTNRGRSSGTSDSWTQQVQSELLPSVFLELRKGGGRRSPEAIIIQGGRTFRHGRRPWLRCAIKQ